MAEVKGSLEFSTRELYIIRELLENDVIELGQIAALHLDTSEGDVGFVEYLAKKAVDRIKLLHRINDLL